MRSHSPGEGCLSGMPADPVVATVPATSVRFLAYGGPSHAERARMGVWPEIPGGVLLDPRGIAVGAPAFGLGVLRGRPFLVYREMCGEGPSAVVTSFLIEPRREDFERFHWNG